MKTFTVTEYAKLTGRTTTAIYKGKRYKPFITVVNGVKSIAIPDEVDPLTLDESVQTTNSVLNSVDNRSKPLETPVEAACDPIELVELRAKVEVLSADKRELQAQLDGLKGILEGKEETIATLQQSIDALERDKVYLQGQYQQQAELLNRLTLPAPKKSLGERFREALGIKSKTI